MILEVKENVDEINDSAKKILESFEAPFHVQNKELMLNISIGAAIYPDHGRQMDSLNNYAELALLEAKRIGGNTFRIYHSETRLSTEARINLEAEIRRAIAQNELAVYYQPKVDTKTKKFIALRHLYDGIIQSVVSFHLHSSFHLLQKPV